MINAIMTNVVMSYVIMTDAVAPTFHVALRVAVTGQFLLALADFCLFEFVWLRGKSFFGGSKQLPSTCIGIGMLINLV